MSFTIKYYITLILLVVANPKILGSLANSLFPDSLFEKSSSSNEPEFVEAIRNVTVPAGREAILGCSVSNLGKFKVAWIKSEDQTILTLDQRTVTHNGRVTVSYENLGGGAVQWFLHIKQVRPSDGGCYMCQVNTAIMKKNIGCIDVNVSPTIIDDETSGDLTIREGDNVTLVCKASGRPKPKIIWKREDGEKIIMRRGLRDVYKGFENITGETLQFIRLDRRQMGTFLCIATNDVPPAKSKRIVLDVNFPPLIKVPSQLLGAPFGTDLKLRCEIQAMPKPFVYWMKNRGEMLIDGTKYSIEETKHSYKVSTSLTIRNFGPSNIGVYTCVATNSLGKAEGSIRLHEVKTSKTTATATEHHLVTLSGFATPPLSTEGRNIGMHHTNNRESSWNNYDVAPRDPVMTPHDPKSEINRDDISAISSSVSTSSYRIHHHPPYLIFIAGAIPLILFGGSIDTR